ncbi:MAG: lyase family protein, partial [Clostridium sp.]
MRDLYNSPLNSRYASKEMSYIFSDDMKFSTWRKLWVALAEGEKELGLNISEDQINELKANIYNINYDDAIKREKEVRHDVMSHVYAYGLQCPEAKGIIHLGATSCYVGDNTDIIIMKDGLLLIKKKIVTVLNHLSNFAIKYKDMPTLGFTHFQPAQLTTVGKRATLWMQDLLLDIENIDFLLSTLKLRGVKGTTGTQASFMTLFDNDEEKVKALDKIVAEKMGFESSYGVTGQTYPRKLDSIVLNRLSEVAQSAYKFSNDLRLLQSMKEIEEPFEKNQIGSSAMAYKRNPMRSERMSSLARYVIVNSLNPAITAATQWFERTLDDSAN